MDAAVLKLADWALRLAADDPEVQFLRACSLALAGNWPESAELLEGISANESAFFSMPFFRTAVQTGHVEDTIALLQKTGADERWRPLYETLRAARAGTPDYLRNIAPGLFPAAPPKP